MEAPQQLGKKRKENLAMNFIESGDITQIPINRKMLNELEVEHQ